MLYRRYSVCQYSVEWVGSHPFLCEHDDVLHEEVVEVAGVYAVPERQVDERAELWRVLVAQPLQPLVQVPAAVSHSISSW